AAADEVPVGGRPGARRVLPRRRDFEMGQAEEDLQNAAPGGVVQDGMGHVQSRVGDEMKALQHTEDGIAYEDGVLQLSDGREMAARHPDRVSAATVVVGGTPLVEEEVLRLVGVNARGYALAEQGWQPLFEFLAEVRQRLLSDEGMQGVLSDAPETDRRIMSDPAWQRMSRVNLAETLRQGAEGWADESLAMHDRWDFDPSAIETSVTWWHGDDDMNAPLSAARRMVATLRKADLRIWHGEGHFASLVHDKEIVKDLLSRAQ